MSSFLSLVSFSLNSPSNRCAVYTNLDLKTWPAFLWVLIFSVVISRVKSINQDLPIENERIKNAAILLLSWTMTLVFE